ncbi:DUF2516 family protein [Pseudonocardia benzenivorans]|uniref:Integral membrane protein n=3 Tax=Pseudonocardia TaxID=1847 RepID=F4CSA1_PSEUX|nr:DUF2516 family protein [Pseudonocardia dioxanivorans]AEA22854.1 Protein of unknown function DUF2516 [Pseudonocardia dioxanivorans CB1190]GJF06782.1 hypothetical protein PSD17_57290 [Pseudonocardia sp. D17]
MSVLRPDYVVLCVIGIVVAVVSAYALVHAARARKDAFELAGKLSKNAWLGIVGASSLFLLLIPVISVIRFPSLAGVILAFQGLYGQFTIFWLAGLVATLVYLVDVKPAVAGIGRGER